MVRHDYAIESALFQQGQCFKHINVPVVDKYFIVFRDFPFYIPKMYIADTLLPAILPYGIVDISMGHLLDTAHTELIEANVP